MNFYLIRGLSRESAHWGDFTSILQKQFVKCTIKLVDLPGFGIFNHLPSPASIEAIVSFIDSHYPVNPDESNFIVATSLGGMIGLEWVKSGSNKFDGLVMMNCSFKNICTFSERVKKSSRAKLFQLFYLRNSYKREKIIFEINTNYPRKNEEILSHWVHIQHLRRVKKRNFFKQVIAAAKYVPKLENIEIPLLILASQNDKLVCSSCFLKIHKIFGGNIVWHKKAGHCIPLDDPNWVSIQIDKWVNKI